MAGNGKNKMGFRSKVAWLVAVGLAVLAYPTWLHAQPGYEPSSYALPTYGYVHDNYNFQPFAPVTEYQLGNKPRPNEGLFFSYERLHWSFSKPDCTPIGVNGPPISVAVETTNFAFQTNSLNTSVPKSAFGWGNRYELGYMEDDRGWLVSVLGGVRDDRMFYHGFGIFPLEHDNVIFIEDDAILVGDDVPVPTEPDTFFGIEPDGFLDVSIVFDDPFNLLLGFTDADGDGVDDDNDGDGTPGRDGTGATDLDDLRRIATLFDAVVVRNKTTVNGVELMAMHRKRPFHNGSILEGFLGVRYLEMKDFFSVSAVGGILDESDWDTQAANRIVGPQVGAKWYKQHGRLVLSGQGRFMAGANFITIKQDGFIGTTLQTGEQNSPQFLTAHSIWSKVHNEQFSPVGEFRVDAALQLTKAISLKVGWTGLVTGQIARASTNVRYTLPDLGIYNSTEDFYTHGVNFGIEVNR